MGVRSKTLVTILLVGTVVGALTIQTQNKSLFKGQLNKDALDIEQEETGDTTDNVNTLPDLKAGLVVQIPEQENGDVVLDVTIENLGPGSIAGRVPFRYSVFLNEIEVFSHVDSYTDMAAGDAFNFQYPVSRLIYQYGNQGTAKLVVDGDKVIKETDESNNTVELSYSF